MVLTLTLQPGTLQPGFFQKILGKIVFVLVPLVIVFGFHFTPVFVEITPLNVDQMLKVHQLLLYVFLALCRPRSTRLEREGW